MYITIKTLWKRYKNKSKIARLTGHSWKTINKVVRAIENGKERPEGKEYKSIVDPYKDKVIELLEKGLSGIRVHEEITLLGFEGTYSCVKKYIRKIKKKSNIFIRIHTLAGEEAQVDFGYVGLTPDNTGKRRKTWVFNMRLSYSRLDYYEKVYDQTVETFIQCHINAFEYFGGVPEVVKIDNLKAAVLEANFYQPVFQEMYKNFAMYYGFDPIPCRVRQPNDKGKVESGIKYVKSNFFKGKIFKDEADCNKKLSEWLKKANNRIHGTTRRVPREVFDTEEAKKLKRLPDTRFKYPKAGTRFVYHDCHIFVEYNYYSVPYEYVGELVEIELDNKFLRIFHNGKQITIHPKLEGRGNFQTDESHYPKYKCRSNTELQEYYQIKMASIGKYAQQLFFLILSENKSFWSQSVKGILSLVNHYPVEVVEKACRRALVFNTFTYQIIKNICENGAYDLPIDEKYIQEDVE
jgi:transposase